MGKLNYYAKVLLGAKFKKLNVVINRVHSINNKNKIAILLDIIKCARNYGCGYNDYNIFGWYDMNENQRKTYVTRMINKTIINTVNDPEFDYIFDNKSIFNEKFTKYLNREYLSVEKMTLSDFDKFMSTKDIIFAKPDSSESGKGIEKLTKFDFTTISDMYDYIKSEEKNFGVIEEQIVQHQALSKLYPLAINSLRIVTLVRNGVAHCAYVTSKMGNEGKYVDNLENSGLCCPVDMQTGKIIGVAHTSKLVNYEKHPYSGVEFIGYQLPYIKEAVELAKKAALEVSEVGYIGWDVCITENGPSIIEGNNYPGYDFWQLPEHTPDKIGLLPFFVKLIPELRNKSNFVKI